MSTITTDVAQGVSSEVLLNAEKIYQKSNELKDTIPLWKVAIGVLNSMCGIKDEELCDQLIDEELKQYTSDVSLENSKGLNGLSKDNIKDILTYVKLGLALPTTQSDVVTALGYNESSEFSIEHPTLTPSRFLNVFKPVKEHALTWSELEADLKDEGMAVSIYGTKFVSHANFVIKVIDSLGFDQWFKKVEDIEFAELSSKGEKNVVKLLAILEKWKTETLAFQDSTNNVLDRLRKYESDLANKIQPSVLNLKSEIDILNMSEEKTALKAQIDELTSLIDQDKKEYDTNVGLAFTGAAGLVFPPVGIFTWAITGGVFGAKAEEIRKRRNKNIEERRILEAKFNTYERISSKITDTNTCMLNLSMAINNAIIGLQSLNCVWGAICGYIESASESLKAVKNDSDLLDFEFEITAAKDAWAQVPSLAKELLDLFAKARSEAFNALEMKEAK